MNPLLLYAALFALGVAVGGYWQDLQGDNELLEVRNQSLQEQIKAADAARKDEREARDAQRDVLDQPTTVRVLCRTEPLGGVPGAGGAVAGDAVPARGDERDIAARLREVLAVDSHNRKLIDGLQAREEKPR